jgi:hypothetical protein
LIGVTVRGFMCHVGDSPTGALEGNRMMKAPTGNRGRLSATLPVTVLAILLMLPTEVAAVTSGGWNNLGQGATATTPALNDKTETFYSVGNLLYVGGDFTNAGGLPNGDHIAVWNGTAWSALGGGLGDPACAVYAIAVDPVTGLVFAGGSCQDAGGDVAADRIAVFNGSTWAHLTNVSLNGPVFALAVIGRYLYIAGGFSRQMLGTPANAIVRWNIDTHGMESITPAIDSIGGTPAAIQPDGAGGFYLGGNFIDAAGDTSADFISHWTGGMTWTRLGNVPLNARVRALSMDGGNLYVGGEFTSAGGVSGADKVAKWNGSSWSAIGGASFFGTSAGVAVFGIWADHGSVVASGYFNNAGGNAKADGIAAFNGTTWTNVGTSASGTDGPVSLNTTMFCVRVVGARLYLGGLDSSIADNPMMGSSAWYRFRQPDGLIKVGTGAFVGNNIYNTNAKNQIRSVTVPRGQSATFTIQIVNDGLAMDSFNLKGGQSGSGFTARYTVGGVNVSGQVNTGTYPFSLAPGATKTVTLQVSVGSGAVVGSSKSFLVTATSTGGGTARDAVKATVKAS